MKSRFKLLGTNIKPLCYLTDSFLKKSRNTLLITGLLSLIAIPGLARPPIAAILRQDEINQILSADGGLCPCITLWLRGQNRTRSVLFAWRENTEMVMKVNNRVVRFKMIQDRNRRNGIDYRYRSLDGKFRARIDTYWDSSRRSPSPESSSIQGSLWLEHNGETTQLKVQGDSGV